MNTTLFNLLEPWLKLVSPFLAIAAFVWGIYTYQDTERQQLEQASIEAERIAETRRIEAERIAATQRIEATRPFLDKQLSLYTETTQVTSIIASSKVITDVETATQRFYELYWGELALVEGKDVRAAMVLFNKALDAKKGQGELAPLALKLANACRAELAFSWNIENWKQPLPNLK